MLTMEFVIVATKIVKTILIVILSNIGKVTMRT